MYDFVCSVKKTFKEIVSVVSKNKKTKYSKKKIFMNFALGYLYHYAELDFISIKINLDSK